ncbi:MAG: recombination regulator RecX [Hylemonella sp.]
MNTTPQLSLKGRALRLLSQREHSRAELVRKLAAHESVPGELAQALDDLQARGFISEQRVAASVVHRHASRLGNARLRQELAGKGLERSLIDQTLIELRGTEQARAQEVWARKFGSAPISVADRARQMRFLLTRGFSAEVVRRVLASAGAPEPDEAA